MTSGGPVVVLDVGETLVDETPLWAAWADRLGVTPLTMAAALGAVIARGGHHEEALRLIRPGIDVAAERAAMRAQRGDPPVRFYPDAAPCLRELARRGTRVVVGGNQPSAMRETLAALDLPVLAVTSSADLGAEKPAPEFFHRIAALAGVPPERCVHVGDRLDNDVVAARAAGMTAVWLRRGPWALLQAERHGDGGAAATIDTLADLPAVLTRLGR